MLGQPLRIRRSLRALGAECIDLRNGSSLDNVVKCTAMLADMSEWPAMNAIYVQHFPAHLPARSAFGAAALALGGRVEIECIATVDP